ncbi:hypothetical protein BaRGS_00010983 [Batillaria attramentaria]|uniref:Uncharacterized protein n=1 Tax=Batillaria attramentaria TaxID=370345 RepID=A0ABD0LE63_9CAEN
MIVVLCREQSTGRDLDDTFYNRKYEDGPAVPMTYMNDDHFTYGPWASLWLIRARTEHVGIYTVSVTVRKVDNTTQVYSSSASLAVGSYPPSTTDGLLHLGMFPKAHRDRSEYWIFLFILYCGNFTTRGKPNVRAYLTFPDEESMEMVDYDPMAGQFYVLLNVTSPVGVYSCHLPKEQGAMGCLLYNSSLLARATLNVTSQMKASAIEAALKQEAEEKASEDNN